MCESLLEITLCMSEVLKWFICHLTFIYGDSAIIYYNHKDRLITVMYFKFVPHVFEFWNGLHSQEKSQYLGEINIYLII